LKNDLSLNQNSGFHTFDIESFVSKHVVSVELACLHQVIFKNYFFSTNELEKLFNFIHHLMIWLRVGKIDAVISFASIHSISNCKTN